MKNWLKYTLVIGLLYTVIWSVIIYFIWDDSPEIFTWLDVISGVVILHLSMGIYKGTDYLQGTKLALRLIQIGGLIYATVWTVVVMIFLELDIAEIFLPLDAISLYATVGIIMKIWKAILREHQLDFLYIF